MTDGRTDILPQHSPRYAYASRGKKLLIHPHPDLDQHQKSITPPNAYQVWSTLVSYRVRELSCSQTE